MKTREFTFRAVLLGLLLSVVLGAANTYLGLYAGLTVSASIPAAVISMFLLRKVLRSGSILENNIVQSMASAGESLAAGVIFTVPALIISENWHDFEFWPTTLVAFSGGMLGILFLIPFRKPFISKEQQRPELKQDLIYPEGEACALVLKTGDSGQAGSIFTGMSLGILFKFITSLFVKASMYSVIPFSASGRRAGYLGLDFSAALAGVGFIVGFRIAAMVFLGGIITWMIILPLFGPINPATSLEPQVFSFWSSHGRFAGVGAMLIGTVESLLLASSVLKSISLETLKLRIRSLIKGPSTESSKEISHNDKGPELANPEAFHEIPLPESRAPEHEENLPGSADPVQEESQKVSSSPTLEGPESTDTFSESAAGEDSQGSGNGSNEQSLAANNETRMISSNDSDTERDLPSWMISILIVFTACIAGFLIVQMNGWMAIPLLFWVLLLSLPVVAVAAYLVGLVGSSNSPVSGITLSVLLLTGLILIPFMDGEHGVLAMLLVAGMICCAAATAGDIAQDLRTGSLIGAHPYKQQIAEILGVAISAPIFALVLQLLHETYGIGNEGLLKAPQATLFASLASSMFSDAPLPVFMISVGTLLGAILFFWNRYGLYRIPIMPVAVGMYLPLSVSTPLLLGGILYHAHRKWSSGTVTDSPESSANSKSRWEKVRKWAGDPLLYSSGLIAGEALGGILLALWILYAGGSTSSGGSSLLGLIIFLIVLLPMTPLISRFSRRS